MPLNFNLEQGSSLAAETEAGDTRIRACQDVADGRGEPMTATSAWPIIHAERAALAGDLAGLDDRAWSTPSLCTGWSVRDVLAHMTATAKLTPAGFLAGFVGSGLRFDAMTAKGVARETAGTPADTLAEFRAQQLATVHPPGPLVAMVGEAIVHGEDIRRPLGITHAYPMAAVFELIGAKKRIAGLRLQASDAEWSSGSGPVVSGPALSLLLAMTGRRVALEDCSGQGLPVLSERM